MTENVQERARRLEMALIEANNELSKRGVAVCWHCGRLVHEMDGDVESVLDTPDGRCLRCADTRGPIA